MMMHNRTDSVRPRHSSATAAAAAHHPNVVLARKIPTTIGGDNNCTAGSRLHSKRPASSSSVSAKRPSTTASSCRQRIIRMVIFMIIGFHVILFVFLTLVGIISMKRKSLRSSSLSSVRINGAASDPMQSFLSPSLLAQQQQHHHHPAKKVQGERLAKEGNNQASATIPLDSVNASPEVVGMFQGLPVTYHAMGMRTPSLASSVHCVGENFQHTSWMVRSCQFRNLCFDMNTKDFVLFQSVQEERLQQRLEKLQQRRNQQQQKQCQEQQQQKDDNKCQSSLLDSQHFVTISSLALHNHTKVSLGSLSNHIIPQWTNSANDMDHLQWFPKIIPHSSMPYQGYYQLPNDIVWVPFYAPLLLSSNIMMKMNADENLVWNDWFSIYTLLSMFDLLDSHLNSDDVNSSKRRLLLMRKVLDEPPPLSATCDVNATTLKRCRILLEKFLPAMGIHPPPLQFSTNLDYQFTLFQQQHQQKSPLICARYGAAGIGMLSSSSSSSAAHHQHDGSGKTLKDTLSDYYKDTFNMGRGATLRAFGNFMANNLGIHNNNNRNNDPDGDSSIHQQSFTPPYIITIAFDSSSLQYKRDVDHSMQLIAHIQKEFAAGGGSGVVDNDNDVVIQSFDVQQLTLVEQAQIAAESVIFVSVCGGGSIMATFLSPGASLIIIHDNELGPEGEHEQYSNQQELSSRIDWDLLSNAGYFRAHWLQIQRNHDLVSEIASLVKLIRHELDRVRHE